MGHSGDDQGASVNEWVNVVRRARLHATTKLVALLMASYADPDGTRIYPGVARLVIQSGLGYRTVQREMARLRTAGLTEQMPRKGLRRGWSAPYRLILAADLLEKVDVLTPAAEDKAAEDLAGRYRAKHRREKTSRHSDGVGSQDGPVDNPLSGGTTSRHSDGVQSDDLTPWGDATSRHDQLADQEKAHATLPVPLPNINPPSDEADLRYPGTGSADAGARNDGDIDISAEEARRRALAVRQAAEDRRRRAGVP
jgi:hypothetical protein